MRTAFFDALLELAAHDSRLMLVVGDLGFRMVETFADRYPKQFLNVGVAEQNMVGISAGLAMSGRTVFAYSIGNFPTLRCFEQIRNDVCHHNADVKIVTSGGGLAYGSLGISHHATEDIAIMRSLPNMTVIAPGDPAETRAATNALARTPGPSYLRLGRAGEPQVHAGAIHFKLGRAITIGSGHDVAIVSTGGMLDTAVRVGRRLEADGISTRVLSMHTVKPLDVTTLLATAAEVRALFTLEEHSITGGLGGAVAETLAEAGPRHLVFKRIGLPSSFASGAGSQDYFRAQFGLSEQSVATTISDVLLHATPSLQPAPRCP